MIDGCDCFAGSERSLRVHVIKITASTHLLFGFEMVHREDDTSVGSAATSLS